MNVDFVFPHDRMRKPVCTSGSEIFLGVDVSLAPETTFYSQGIPASRLLASEHLISLLILVSPLQIFVYIFFLS